ncbi:unnamed protein product [Effrenium voratum]|uniref:Uncharacterized protein n=1 Tax=Effrenium voratum TaxID=2562239 RepID=A0AA36MT82_9DINO|nr:unnamed protein product [Effrenium voratum]CAJ1378107.1 unnamed protein product [Effrenium voratum]CAJ1424934.1 unnamed protein product [Effrenium voratum]|mmetsp:Transcript_126092/g.299417  ORF Transcript_126092/g.299417 Transcript_126092/m.299417 type:complete len:202 (+) Transcript_126092:67-672(+)
MTEKELTKGAKRILDESEENTCGFAAFFILDQDGYGKKTKGSSVEVPWHLMSCEGDEVLFQAELPANPLFYLQVSSEENNFFWGQWWLGDSKRSKTNAICDLIPKDCRLIQKSLEGDTVDFECQAEMPFLKNSSTRLVTVKFTTKEQKFVTKVVKAQLKLPKAVWLEWKQHRLRLWRASKVWAGEDKDDDEKKDDKDKKDE